jgi:hypothetical protein
MGAVIDMIAEATDTSSSYIIARDSTKVRKQSNSLVTGSRGFHLTGSSWTACALVGNNSGLKDDERHMISNYENEI